MLWVGRILGVVLGFVVGLVLTEWGRLPWVTGSGDSWADALAQTIPFVLAFLGWFAGSYAGRRIVARTAAR